MFRDLMGNIFPADWMVMNLVQMRVFLRAINQYSDVLNMYFLDQTHFELQVRLRPPSRQRLRLRLAESENGAAAF